MKIVLASNNHGKLVELQAMFAPLGIKVMGQGELFEGEAPEPHCTFVENALSKARYAAQATGLPAIADDSGLCVDALGGLPGVDTAYYCLKYGYDKTDANNVTCLLENLKAFDNRKAAVVSVLVGVRSAIDPEPLISVGRVNVEITSDRRGTNGFGFDPIALLPDLGKTFAEMTQEEKSLYSHRGRSTRAMIELLKTTWLA